MNNIIIDEDKTIFLDSEDYTIDINKDVKAVIYQLVYDKSINIVINLNKENSNIEYHYSTINYNDNNFSIKVNHNVKNTISNIYNYGINVNNNRLHFDIEGIVLNNLDKVICNQENQIINLEDGKSTILPKLLIDSYDIVANHSAYIGKFKDEKIFYLTSRGIERKKAYKLLIKSFLLPSIETKETRDYLEKIENI